MSLSSDHGHEGNPSTTYCVKSDHTAMTTAPNEQARSYLHSCSHEQCNFRDKGLSLVLRSIQSEVVDADDAIGCCCFRPCPTLFSQVKHSERIAKLSDAGSLYNSPISEGNKTQLGALFQRINCERMNVNRANLPSIVCASCSGANSCIAPQYARPASIALDVIGISTALKLTHLFEKSQS